MSPRGESGHFFRLKTDRLERVSMFVQVAIRMFGIGLRKHHSHAVWKRSWGTSTRLVRQQEERERKPSACLAAGQENVIAMQCRSGPVDTSPRPEGWPKGQERKPFTGMTGSQGNVKAMQCRSRPGGTLRGRRDGRKDRKGSRSQA